MQRKTEVTATAGSVTITDPKSNTNDTPAETKSSPVGETFKQDDKKAQLETYEKIIEQNEKGIFATGSSLGKINTQDLYKVAGYTSFELYCKERWDISDKHAYRLMDAAKCYDVLAKRKVKEKWDLPRNEAQIRQLAALPENDWERTWRKFMKKYSGKAFTAEDVEAFINGRQKKKKVPGKEKSDAANDVQPNGSSNAHTETLGGKSNEVDELSGVNSEALQDKMDEMDKLIDQALELTEDEEVREILEKIKSLIEFGN